MSLVNSSMFLTDCLKCMDLRELEAVCRELYKKYESNYEFASWIKFYGERNEYFDFPAKVPSMTVPVPHSNPQTRAIMQTGPSSHTRELALVTPGSEYSAHCPPAYTAAALFGYIDKFDVKTVAKIALSLRRWIERERTSLHGSQTQPTGRRYGLYDTDAHGFSDFADSRTSNFTEQFNFLGAPESLARAPESSLHPLFVPPLWQPWHSSDAPFRPFIFAEVEPLLPLQNSNFALEAFVSHQMAPSSNERRVFQPGRQAIDNFHATSHPSVAAGNLLSQPSHYGNYKSPDFIRQTVFPCHAGLKLMARWNMHTAQASANADTHAVAQAHPRHEILREIELDAKFKDGVLKSLQDLLRAPEAQVHFRAHNFTQVGPNAKCQIPKHVYSEETIRREICAPLMELFPTSVFDNLHFSSGQTFDVFASKPFTCEQDVKQTCLEIVFSNDTCERSAYLLLNFCLHLAKFKLNPQLGHAGYAYDCDEAGGNGNGNLRGNNNDLCVVLIDHVFACKKFLLIIMHLLCATAEAYELKARLVNASHNGQGSQVANDVALTFYAVVKRALRYWLKLNCFTHLLEGQLRI